MQLINEWYYFTGVIDKKTCNKLIKLGGEFLDKVQVDMTKGATGEERKTGKKISFGSDTTQRISDIKWLNEQWVYDLITPYMETANINAGWNFDIQSTETPQLTKYKKGGFYSWHSDGGADHLSVYDSSKGKFLGGYARKLSMSILLNEDFSGGRLQFVNIYSGKRAILTSELKGTGSVIVFPSFMHHRVAPITKGTRYSLVAWFLGPPFK